MQSLPLERKLRLAQGMSCSGWILKDERESALSHTEGARTCQAKGTAGSVAEGGWVGGHWKEVWRQTLWGRDRPGLHTRIPGGQLAEVTWLCSGAGVASTPWATQSDLFASGSFPRLGIVGNALCVKWVLPPAVGRRRAASIPHNT